MYVGVILCILWVMKSFYRDIYGSHRECFVYTLEEATEIGLKPVYWRDAVAGDRWVLCDDNTVVELLRVNQENVLVTTVGTILRDDRAFYGNRVMKSPKILQSTREHYHARTGNDREVAISFLKHVSNGMGLLEAIVEADRDNGIYFPREKIHMPYIRAAAILQDDTMQKAVAYHIRQKFLKTYHKTIEEMREMAKVKAGNEELTRDYVISGLREIAEKTDDDKVKLAALKELARMIGQSTPNALNNMIDEYNLPELPDLSDKVSEEDNEPSL